MNTAPGVVHVIDDDASWRKSVQRLMSAAGYQVALYESAESFLEGGPLAAPGCILLDVRMPGLTGLQFQQRIVATRQELPIVFLSGHGDIPLTVQAMKAGAQDFLTKPVDTDVLLRAVSQAIARDREVRGKREQLELLRDRIHGLTPTERMVFDLVVRGRLNKQIAAELGMTERTVKWHRHNLMPKLHVRSLAGLVSLAEQLGMISAQDRPGPAFE